MLDRPRPHHYRFAHQVLARDALAHPHEVWSLLTGPDACEYLEMTWTEAAGRDACLAVDGLRVDPVVRRGGWEFLVVAMPSPEGPTEAHYAALVRPVGDSTRVRYFMMEQGLPTHEAPERAYVAEWRTGMRIRGRDLPEIALEAFIDYLEAELRPSRLVPAATAGAQGKPRSRVLPIALPAAIIAAALLAVAVR